MIRNIRCLIDKGALVVTLIVLLGAGPARGAVTPKQYWAAGDRYAENKLFLDAVASYTQAIRTNTGEVGVEDVARIFNRRGLAYQNMEEPDKAIDDFSNAVRLDEKNPEFYLNRGRLYLQLKQYGDARNDMDAVIKLDPRNAEAYAARGRASLEAGDRDQAMADYEKAVTLDTQNVPAWYGLGLAYKGAGRTDDALRAFNRLLELEPKDPAASYQEAAIFSRLGRIDSACVWLETAVENGFRDWNAIKNDSDFDRIRKVDCYRRLLSGR
jgi:tetratricopeptide (TPR) repeat protein